MSPTLHHFHHLHSRLQLRLEALPKDLSQNPLRHHRVNSRSDEGVVSQFACNQNQQGYSSSRITDVLA